MGIFQKIQEIQQLAAAAGTTYSNEGRDTLASKMCII